MPIVNLELIVNGRVSPEMYEAAGLFIRRSPVAQNFIKRLAMATSTSFGDWSFSIIPKPLAKDLPPVLTADEEAEKREETHKQTLKHFAAARARVSAHCLKTGATGGVSAVKVDLGADVLVPNTDKTFPSTARKPRVKKPGPRRDGGLFARELKPTTPHVKE